MPPKGKAKLSPARMGKSVAGKSIILKKTSIVSSIANRGKRVIKAKSIFDPSDIQDDEASLPPKKVESPAKKTLPPVQKTVIKHLPPVNKTIEKKPAAPVQKLTPPVKKPAKGTLSKSAAKPVYKHKKEISPPHPKKEEV